MQSGMKTEQRKTCGVNMELVTQPGDGNALSLTLFTVRLAVLHVEGVASDWLLAGHARKAGHVPRVLQGIRDLLRSTGEKTERP